MGLFGVSPLVTKTSLYEGESTMDRQRVQHVHYGWVGDVKEVKAGKWWVVAWDNGTVTTEHEDDVKVRTSA